MERESKEPIAPVHSRRKILFGAGAGGVALFSAGVGWSLGEYRDDKSLSTVEFFDLHPEISDIAIYRSGLGLSPLPSEVKGRLVDQSKDWKIPDSDFSNLLPPAYKSYGMANEFVQEAVFGKQSGRLVNSVLLDELKNGGAYFMDFNGRKCILSPDIHSANLHTYLDTVLHEAIGHGSDPQGYTDIYPADTLFRVSRGKWRMLSQAFNVEGQFFHHPKDMMLPQAEKNIGLQFARKYRDKDIDNMFASDSESLEALQILSGVALGFGKSLSELKFNKAVCRQIGKSLMQDIITGKLAAGEEVLAWYEPVMEDSLREIYAEMLKMAILHPEKINYNPEILAGAVEIISAIREENVDINSLRTKLLNLPQEIIDRNNFENFYLNPGMRDLGLLGSEPEVGPLSDPDKGMIASGNERRLKVEADFSKFVQKGELPSHVDLESELGRLCYIYGFYRSEIEYRYHLQDISVARLDFSFDPQLDVWDIEEIEKAIDSSYIRRLIIDVQQDPENVNTGELKKKTAVMQKFVQSPAYGT